MKYIPLLMLAVLLSNCRKSDETSCVAGPNGDVSIVVRASHNGTEIPNYGNHLDTAFVKYGTTTNPGTDPASYDTYFVGEPGEDHIHCEELKCGSYYIYRVAFDSVTNTRYTGGLGVSFTQIGGEIDTTINVN